MYNWLEKIMENRKILKIVGYFLKWLPLPFILGVCSGLGFLLYLFAGPLKNRIRRNMLDLLPETSEQSVNRCTRNYFRNFIISLYEILFASQSLESQYQTKFSIQNEHYLDEALQQGRGAIVYTAHLGNFFYYYWYLSQKYPCLTVATAGSKELRSLYLIFQRLGCKGLDYDSTPPIELVRTIREHLKTNGVVFLMGDFWRSSFPLATFFDRLTRSPGGTAALALDQQVPIVPFYGFYDKRFRHQLVFEPPIYLYEELKRGQRMEATNRLNQLLEQMILRKPEQWFYWFNVDERWEPCVNIEMNTRTENPECAVTFYADPSITHSV